MQLSVDDIERLFCRHGDRAYAGEGVSQTEHALQSAWLAEQEGAADELVVAAFLHDLGHLINDQGETPTLRGIDDRHEYVAVAALGGRFGRAVLEPIRLHVEAKRYLCARGDDRLDGPAYRARLSPDSLRSLELQGGTMSEAQADAFLPLPGARDALRLRAWDDRAKLPGLATPPLAHYLGILQRSVLTQAAGSQI